MEPTQPPSTDDPLREPTIGRRIRAAYLQAGFNRRTWAAALDMSYQGVDLIDSGKSVPQLPTLIRMQELIGRYTLDELVHGRSSPAKRHEQTLTADAVATLLWLIGSEPDEREAFALFTNTSGKFDRLTRTLVIEWLQRYRTARAEGATQQQAIDLAKDHARSAQAKADAVSSGIKPVTPAQLAAAGELLRKRTEPAQPVQKTRKRRASRIDPVTAPVPRKRKRHA